MAAPAVDIGRFTGRDIIVQYGLAHAPVSFQARVKRFLHFYLGPSDAPVPFGGRSVEIAELNCWLRNDKAPRNLLITAPAGRGKTALLVRWIQQLNSDWQIAFVPISIRYETNRAAIFYQALAARLAIILEENLPTTPTDPGSFYKDKVIEYFDRFDYSDKRCLVILDGLDEAAGWQVDTSMLPPTPQRNIKIVVSARLLGGDCGSAEWLQRLGWTALRSQAMTMEVSPLDRGGIADVFQKMRSSLAKLAQDVDFTDELYRLTERGDPLLLELYIAALLQPGKEEIRLLPQDLRRLRPGYRAYFREWFDQQRRVWSETGVTIDEDLLNTVLAILACALGPLKLADLEQLIARVCKTNHVVSMDIIRPLRRFIIGDGTIGFA